VPGAPHETTFAAVNAVVSRLRPRPEFICFPGDEVIGLTADDDVLRAQWRHWFDREMSWLDRDAVPLYHTTANHTTYDARSEAVFREVLAHLPRNGPPGQEGLTYFVRRGDLLLVFVNTTWTRTSPAPGAPTPRTSSPWRRRSSIRATPSRSPPNTWDSIARLLQRPPARAGRPGPVARGPDSGRR
jgi:hypothetical protein